MCNAPLPAKLRRNRADYSAVIRAVLEENNSSIERKVAFIQYTIQYEVDPDLDIEVCGI